MTIVIQRRKAGMQVGGCGGVIRAAFETLDKLEKPPESNWEEYLLNEYGGGNYMVTKCSGNKKIEVLFKGSVGVR